MSNYYGDFLAGKTIRIEFNTAGPSGAPATLIPGTPTFVISKDGVDVAPSGGVTLNVDFGSVQGRNVLVIDMSVDTTTFTTGSDYKARLGGSANVGGTSQAGVYVGHWSIQNRSVAALTSVILGAGSVQASPTPTATAFAVGGLASGLVAGDLVGMGLIFQSGSRSTARRIVSAHARAAGIDTLTLSAALGAAPAAGDTVLLV